MFRATQPRVIDPGLLRTVFCSKCQKPSQIWPATAKCGLCGNANIIWRDLAPGEEAQRALALMGTEYKANIEREHRRKFRRGLLKIEVPLSLPGPGEADPLVLLCQGLPF